MIVEKDYNWFKKLGFYRKRMAYQGDCFVSTEEVSKSYLDWGIKPRYIYNIRSKSICDSLDYRYLIIDSIEEFVDFIQGKDFGIYQRQLERNKGLYSQLNNGNIAPYTRGALDRTLLGDTFGDLFYRPRSNRQIRIQTGSARMEEFNRALLEYRNIWSQRELTETPMLDMSEIGEPTRISDTTVGRSPTPEILDPTRYLRTNDHYYNIWLNDRSEIYLGERRPLRNQNQELMEVQRQLNVIDEQARN